MASPLPDTPTLANLEIIITHVLSVVARLLGIAAFVMLLVGGFQLLTATGDPKKTEAGQKTLTAAIVGLLIVIGGWMFLKILEVTTGTKLTILNLCISGTGPNCQ